MIRRRHTALAVSISALLLFPAACGAPARSKGDALRIIDNPGGGQVVFGVLPDVAGFRDGLAAMLRNVHGHFGERPEVGRFFQARGSDSIAAFFTVTARNQGGTPVRGLVIVAQPQDGKAAAAVLYDDAGRFARTYPDLMRTLGEAWQQQAPASAPAAAPPAAALTMATAGDRSASIGLPQGWRLTAVSGGQLTAEGPQGEMVYLGIMYQQIRDPRSPRGPARGLTCPYGGDLFQAYVSVTNQVRQGQGKPAGSFRLTGSRPLAGAGSEQLVAEVHYEVDLHDGRGLRRGSARIGEIHIPGLPTWAITLSGSNAPVTVAEAEAGTLMAVVRSYSQDARVIAGEARAAVDQIHAIGRAAQIRAEAQSAANDAHNQAFHAHMDDLDRQSKRFQNYQLDRAQLQDNERNERGTVSATAAESLVRANPDRFQIVEKQDFLKGIDY